MSTNVTQKLSWRLAELPAATGLSLPFWRAAVQYKRIKARKVGSSAIVILDEDLREFLAGTPPDDELPVEQRSASAEAA